MKKITTIVAIGFSIVLTSWISIFCNAAPVAGTPEAREIYSSRPYRRPAPARQYIAEAPVKPTVAPELSVIPEPPLEPKKEPSVMPSATETVPSPQTTAGINLPIEELPTINAVENPVKPETVPQVEKPIIEELNVETVVDKLYARLAKIQLEKKNMPETLRFIKKISSPIFKVSTLVEFAEYVSRDDHYRSEAEQLYTLAINGIEALQNGDSVIIPIPTEEPVKPLAPKPPFTPIKPIEPPVVSLESPTTEESKPENQSVPSTVLEPLDDIKEDESQNTEPLPTRKPSFIINDESKKAEESNNVTKLATEPVKPEETEVKPTRRPLPKRTVRIEEN